MTLFLLLQSSRAPTCVGWLLSVLFPHLNVGKVTRGAQNLSQFAFYLLYKVTEVKSYGLQAEQSPVNNTTPHRKRRGTAI